MNDQIPYLTNNRPTEYKENDERYGKPTIYHNQKLKCYRKIKLNFVPIIGPLLNVELDTDFKLDVKPIWNEKHKNINNDNKKEYF